jgi:YD repeat-containing protein
MHIETNDTDDAAGNLTELGDAMGNRTIYGYDAVDDLTSAQQGTVSNGNFNMTCTADFFYDGNGDLETITRNIAGVSTPDVVSTYSYDAAGRLTSLVHSHTQSSTDVIILANYAWTFDATGNIVTQTLSTANGMTMTSDGFMPEQAIPCRDFGGHFHHRWGYADRPRVPRRAGHTPGSPARARPSLGACAKITWTNCYCRM